MKEQTIWQIAKEYSKHLSSPLISVSTYEEQDYDALRIVMTFGDGRKMQVMVDNYIIQALQMQEEDHRLPVEKKWVLLDTIKPLV